MKEFSIEKKGYAIKQVDDYILSLQIETDRIVKEKQSRINELREENFNLIKQLSLYKQKEQIISQALTTATEKAKEIENTAKLKYNLELNNLKHFYDKWNCFMSELIIRYPKMIDFDTNKVLDNIKKDIENLFSNVYLANITKTQEHNDVKKLLDKLYLTSKRKEKQQRHLKINKTPNKDKIIDSENELEFISENNKVNNIKPITNLTLSNDEKEEFDSLLDKFLHTNNNVSSGYQNSILHTKKPKLKKYPIPNESGFDLEQALNPTDDLINIMKGFKLD